MHYEIPSSLPWTEIALSWEAAVESLTRLDQALAESPLREGWMHRAHIEEAAAALWLEGSLVPLEDLVLYDAETPSKLPTRALFQAKSILMSRRNLARRTPDRCLKSVFILGLQERRIRLFEPDPEAASLIDHDPQWDVEGRIEAWLSLLPKLGHLPALPAAAIALDAWYRLEPFQYHSHTVGRLMIPVYLAWRKKTSDVSLCLAVGLKEQRWIDGRVLGLETILNGFCDAIASAAALGISRLRQLQLAQGQIERLVAGRRRSSKLPFLGGLALECPVLSAPLIASRLAISQQAAGSLLAEFVAAGILREMSGRRRFRAYSLI